MKLSKIIESTNFVTGIISNIMLIYLSLRFSKQGMGTYKYLIMIFASYDLYLAIIHFIIDPKIYNFDSVFSLFSARFPHTTWTAGAYCACFTVPLALTNINFLHRYWAVKKFRVILTHLNPIFAILLSLYPIGQATSWISLSMQTALDESHYVQDHYFAKFNVTITGFRVMHHWKDDIWNIRAFLILVPAWIMMIVDFSIAIYLATQTILEIRKAKTFSSNFKALQIKILRALFAQTSVPVLFVYIPFGCGLTFPFLRIDDVFHLEKHCMTITSFFPAWDAIIVILLIKDYRDGLLSIFNRRKVTPSMETTAWMTRLTTTSRAV